MYMILAFGGDQMLQIGREMGGEKGWKEKNMREWDAQKREGQRGRERKKIS